MVVLDEKSTDAKTYQTAASQVSGRRGPTGSNSAANLWGKNVRKQSWWSSSLEDGGGQRSELSLKCMAGQRRRGLAASSIVSISARFV